MDTSTLEQIRNTAVDPFSLCPDPIKESMEERRKELELEAVIAQIAREERKYEKLQAKATLQHEEVERCREKLRSICPHKEVEKKSTYFEGSYLDTAYTTYWYVCKVCKGESEKKTTDHGWYG